MIFKRIISMLLISVLLMMQVAVFAEPSDWAVEFVENATIEGLIPETLKLDYQNNIKRAEYILMALNVLEQNDVDVIIKETEPFVDISSHPYKSEITKAYNAGIVGGYEDKTFRPDQEISREEVAALVFNLVKAINDSTELTHTESLFSDGDKISGWARPYIEFNYSKSIVSGIGKVEGLDTINPQGKTTREQAITLLYKVSKDSELLADFGYSKVELGDKTIQQGDVNTVAKTIGFDVMDIGLEIVKRDDAMFKRIKDDFIQIEYANGSFIEVINRTDYNKIVLHINELRDQIIIKDAVLLGSVLFDGLVFETTMTTYLNDYIEDHERMVYEELNNGAIYDCHLSFGDDDDDLILTVMVEK